MSEITSSKNQRMTGVSDVSMQGGIIGMETGLPSLGRLGLGECEYNFNFLLFIIINCI